MLTYSPLAHPLPGDQPAPAVSAPSTSAPTGTDSAATSEADGYLPWGTTAFDLTYPGVSRLAADLRAALQKASEAAYDDGVGFFVTSGWRSAAQQEALLSDAVSRYGSREEAARWVATAETSLHVRGEAADIDGAGTQDWIAEHGASFGLCLVYDNEPWHVEFRADAPVRGCPRAYPDPTADPRLAG